MGRSSGVGPQPGLVDLELVEQLADADLDAGCGTHHLEHAAADRIEPVVGLRLEVEQHQLAVDVAHADVVGNHEPHVERHRLAHRPNPSAKPRSIGLSVQSDVVGDRREGRGELSSLPRSRRLTWRRERARARAQGERAATCSG